MLAVIGSLAFTSLVIYPLLVQTPYDKWTWFSGHPPLMALFLVLATVGIQRMQAARTSGNYAGRLMSHRMAQATGVTVLLAGAYFIYTNKEVYGKEHFATSHGIAGLTTIIVFILQALGGNLLVMVPGIMGGVPGGMKVGYRYHRGLGYGYYMLAWVTAIGGITQMGWYRDGIVYGLVVATLAGLFLSRQTDKAKNK